MHSNSRSKATFRSAFQWTLALTFAISACTMPQSSTPQAARTVAPAPAQKDDAAQTAAATAAAQSWLAVVDQQKYVESWNFAAKIFQGAVIRETWVSSVTGVRGPLGQVLSRRLKSAEYKTSLPGVPDGKYVVIQFDTSFEHEAQAVETVTPMQESDGAWKVSGYFVK